MSEPVDVVVPVGGLSAIEKLKATHQVKGFKSGKHSLDLFLKRHALKNQEVDSAQTYVVSREGYVIGYYSLTVGSVERADCAPEITSDMPPDYPVPIILLARLAVDRKEHGQGLGSALLKDAFLRIAWQPTLLVRAPCWFTPSIPRRRRFTSISISKSSLPVLCI